MRQRATLGFLLLQANRVVATSQLLDALWPVDEAPASARQILQNAVWGLRSVLSSAALVTQAPGYVLRTDPDRIDLFRFYAQLEAGRAELSSGSPHTAARTLRGALDLWRGVPMADLVEAGIGWPELTSLQGVRLDALEDYFEAELASGRHHAIIGELKAMVETEVLRERSCAQLMLALYRCGRQADALNVYTRVRSALVDELGLEPSRGLQNLQRGILAHDPALATPGCSSPGEPWQTWRQEASPRGTPVVLRGAPAARPELASAAPPFSPAPSPASPSTPTALPAPPASPSTPTSPASPPSSASPERHPRPGAGSAQRKQTSVVLIRTRFDPAAISAAGGDADDLLVDALGRVEKEIESYDGTVVASIGPVTMALFESPGTLRTDAERAVRAGLSVRDALAGATADPAAPGPEVRVAVSTGEALVRTRPGAEGTTSVTGTLLEECQTLLEHTPDREVLVCDRTRRAVRGGFVYRRGDAPESWCVESVDEPLGGADRECELQLLQSVFRRAQRRSTPQMVTVLGEEGSGKNRFVTDFSHWIPTQPDRARCLVGTVRPALRGGPRAIQAEMLSAYCGILPDDPADVVRSRVATAVDGLPLSAERADRVRAGLCELLLGDAPGTDDGTTADAGASSLSWVHFMEAVAHDQPLALVFEQVHRADDRLLDFVEGLSECFGSVPLLVMASARPELLRRRPGWGGGRRHATTITLDQETAGLSARRSPAPAPPAPGFVQELTDVDHVTVPVPTPAHGCRRARQRV
ncbi:BTAD domain-containing putative transcriptional regulator [Streptomyces sp. CC208A]|uniref:BTAD domain-containing putative transcriptional regulator n=1 Tax=Streptomyces sp. CC208A TaxID=3044573 RepID=UPI0024A9743A|nr:BTAD domain-containing putative transcriptional regulator [Streptomyces sp. CC208A]